MESTAPRCRDARDAYAKRPEVDYRLYIGLWNRREPPNIHLNSTASDTIRCERIVYRDNSGQVTSTGILAGQVTSLIMVYDIFRGLQLGLVYDFISKLLIKLCHHFT
jgi:hypothetical protein